MNARQFRDKYIGKAIDIDGAAGVQCVDLFKIYCYDICKMKPFSLGGSGYSNEIVKRFTQLGLNKHFKLVPLNEAQYGDWLVWDMNSPSCPYTHVGMFVKWSGNDRVLTFGMNQGQKAANEIALRTAGIIGCLRLKEDKAEYYPAFTDTSIVDGLRSIKVDNSFSHRAKIALANGVVNKISDYKGTAAQNTELCYLAKKGKLKRA